MKQATRRRLLELNRRFYERTAEAFDATRGRPWPGWQQVLMRLPEVGPVRVLDVGCGNGRLAGFLGEALDERLHYVGVDGSAALLNAAAKRFAGPGREFLARDFLAQRPQSVLPDGPFELVALFGVLHHVPGEDARAELLRACTDRLAPGGLFALTFWRYDRDPRFARKRVDPRSLRPPLDPAELDPGDALLTFGTDPGAVRYCHLPDADERERLLRACGLRQVARFAADGAGDRLNDYVLLGR
jgi:tRNA (cmo5U34)-methyltransferase